MSDHAISLDSLLAGPPRAAQVSREEAVALLNRLAMLQVALLRAACSPTAPALRDAERANEDQMLEVEEAAAMIGVTTRWLYRHAKQLPFTRRISRKI